MEEISRKDYSLLKGTVIHLEVDDDFFNVTGELCTRQDDDRRQGEMIKKTWFRWGFHPI